MECSMRSNHDDRPATVREQGRRHGAKAVKCSRQIRIYHLGPIVLPLSKQEMAPSDPRIANKHRRHRRPSAGDFHHLLYRMRLANICLVERPSSSDSHHLRERALGCCLVSMVMDSDRTGGRCKGQTDRSTNPSGRTSHQHRTFWVHLVCLVDLVHLVGLVQPNKRDKPDKQNTGPIMGGISWEGKPAGLNATSLAASRIPMVRSSHH